MNIPAFCDFCGAAFPSGLIVENSYIKSSRSKSGPCPRCGGMGTVIEGLFHVTGEAIEILAAPTTTIDQLQKLKGIIKYAAANKKSSDEIAQDIEKEIPEISEISRYIPKSPSELVAWLSLILLAIQTISQLSEDDTPEVQIILNQSIQQSVDPKNYYPFNIPKAPPSRNAPCPCGSGNRYKHCCGKPI